MDRAAILALIPHSGGMCLLDRVVRWDAQEITCQSDSHTDTRNPLRRDGQLSALHLLEYGAQTMAVHGGLLAGSRDGTRAGMLVAAREFHLEVARLDDLPHSLDILARKKIASSSALAYEFEVHHAGRRLATGRVHVILQPDGFAVAVT